MSSRFCAGAVALTIFLAAGHTLAAVSAAQTGLTPLSATVESVLAAGRRRNPALRAVALDTSAAAAKAAGADALDDPMISDNYQYYRNPNVFSGHAIMLTQAFPLRGKRSRQAGQHASRQCQRHRR